MALFNTLAKYGKVSARAFIPKLGGDVEVTSLRVTYQVDQIPTGEVILALGRNAETDGVAKIHEKAELLREQLEIQIWLRVSGVFGNKRIFDGFTSGAGYLRRVDAASFAVGVVGWMDDLRASSAHSEIFTVVAPSEFFKPDTHAITFGNLYSQTAGGGALESASIASDLWEISKEGLIDVCSNSILTRPANQALSSGQGERPVSGQEDNSTAIEALDRFSGDSLAMKVSSDRVVSGVASEAFGIIYSNGGGPSIWSKMMTLGGTFAISVIPLVDTARVVALVPCLKSGQVTKTITADQYETFEAQTYSRRSLRGILLLGSQSSVSDGMANKFKKQPAVAGRADSLKKGMFETRAAPRWMTGDLSTDTWTPKSTGVNMQGMRATGEEIGGGAEKGQNEDYNEAMENDRAGDRYAEWLYSTELLRGRRGTLTGITRVDISPGTNVRIQAAGDKLKEYNNKEILAHVYGVTIMASTSEPRTSTVLHLDNLRTEDEDDICLDGHPLFQTHFTGASLV